MPRTSRAGDLAGPFPLFAVLSLVAVAVGCLVARANGAPAGEWVRNLIAWGAGAILAGGLSRWAGQRVLLGVCFVAPLALAATLFGSGQLGVHRWLQLGPLRMNAAELLLPASVIACAAILAARRPWWGAAGATLVVLAIQPDASQATAFGGALIVLIATAQARRSLRLGGALLVVLAIVASWLERDPLAPVPDVEGILRLAWGMSPIAAVVAWAALAGAVLSPLAALRAPSAELRAAAMALATYGALSALVPLAGAFPVPLVGMGMSPILGLWLAIGLLTAVGRRAAP